MATQLAQRPARLLSAFALFLTLMLAPFAPAQENAGNAVQLSGTDYIRTTLWSHQIFNTESFAFEMWVYPTGPGVLIGEPDTANVTLWDIAFAELLQNGSVVVGVPGVPSFTAGTMPLNAWTHLVVTYNHNTSTLAAYINGAPAGSSVGSRNSPADIGRTSVYTLGRGGPRNLGPGGFFRGRIDEVRIWRIALSASDVAATWNRLRTTDATGLMAIWHFDTRVQNNPALSPDSRTAGDNPAWYVPDNQTMPLVTSTVPLQGPSPIVITQTANVAGSSATLRGTGNPQGIPMSVGFEWGPTVAYGNTTSLQSIGSGTSDVAFTAEISQLPPGEYHYRAFAISGDRVLRGNDQVLTIVGPTVATQPANVVGRDATLRGLGNPRGLPMSVHFQWGPTTSYGNTTPTQDIGSGTSDVAFNALLSDLAPGEYHFRAVGNTSAGVVYGADTTFNIVGASVTTLQPTVSDRTVTFRGTSNPHGFPAQVFFEWGPTLDYGSTTPSQAIGSGFSPVNFTETVSNLMPGTYNVRAVAMSENRRVNGENFTFTVAGATVQTQPAQASPGAAELRATVTTRGFPVSAYFEYGTTDFSNTTPLRAIPGSSTPTSFSEPLTNLPPGDYQARAAIVFGDSIIRGEVVRFSTRNKAVRLVGTDYIRTTTWSHQIFNNEDFTFEMWFKPISPGVLINEADTANTALWDYAFAEVFPGGILKAGAPGVPTFTVGNVTFGAWHHLTLVYDGAADLMTAYLDALPGVSSAGDRQTPAEIQRTSVYCLGRGGMSNLGLGNWFSGLFDEVRIWRRPLSAREVADNRTRTIDGPEPGLMGAWHFDSVGTPTHTSPDASGNSNHAWYVPEAATIPLETSDAPLAPDFRPLVAGFNVSNIFPGTIRLQGDITPRGADPTQVTVELLRGGVVEESVVRTLPAQGTTVRISDLFRDLEPGAQYSYRITASNTSGSRIVEGTFTATSWAGMAAQFVGSDFLRTATVLGSHFTSKTITIELWFYPTKAGVIVGENRSTTSGSERSIIEILASGSVEATFRGLTPITVGVANFNQWNHVALRYDETTQTMDGFLNGVKAANRTGQRSDTDLNQYFTFGRAAATRLGTGEFFGGMMDEIRIWSVARSDSDLTTGRSDLLLGGEAGLVLNWRLDTLANNTYQDSGPLDIDAVNVGTELVLSTAPVGYFTRRPTAQEFTTYLFAEPHSRVVLQYTSDFQTWTTVEQVTTPSSGVVRIQAAADPNVANRIYRLAPAPAP